MGEQIYQQFRRIGIENQINDEGAFESNESRRAAISIALTLIGWPAAIVFCLWIILVGTLTPDVHAGGLLIGMVCGGGLVAVMVASVGIGIGWLAHRMCWRTDISVNRLAVAMALLFDLVILGWIVGLLLMWTVP